MIVCGVDLASQPANTAVCVLSWDDARACADLIHGADDDAVVSAAMQATKCGIDVPLGWPDGFVDVVSRHHAGQSVTVPPSTEALRLRATDRWVWHTFGRMPLSVSTDNIGVVALRGIRIQQRIAAEGGTPVDRSGSGRVLEVYPAAALRAWGLPHSGYKRGDDAAERRVEILAALVAGFGIALSPEQTALAATSHDVLDAVISAVVAALAAEGLTTPPPHRLAAAAAREGWIHVPTTGRLVD